MNHRCRGLIGNWPTVALLMALTCVPQVSTANDQTRAPAVIPRPATVLVNAAARTADELSGTWVYSKDAHRVSFSDMNASPPDPRNQRFRDINVQAEERRDPNLFFEFDMQRGPVATLPGAWNTPHTELRHYSGLMWYQRTFVPSQPVAAAAPSGQRAFVRVEAANHHTVVYLNGQRVGDHTGGFTPFSFEVTKLLRPGSNQITLGVDSTRTDEDIPPRLTDWETYGGVTRAVRLVYAPRTYIDDNFVRMNADGSITASVKLDGPDAALQPVQLAIAALGLKTSARTDVNGAAEWTFAAPAALKRWSPDAPQLYDVTISTPQDTLTDRIGFRTIAVSGHDILLNGQPIFLRGISMHEEEFGSAPARIITPQAARALLSEIKHCLNGNYVRLSHYPHSETTVRMADEMGLLVWSEIPVYWSVDFKSAKALDNARRMQAENILRDRNRASVIVWSVGNETPISPARNAFQGQLADDARALDGTRLISAAMWADKKRHADGSIRATIADPLAAKMDLLAINTYTAWYGDETLADITRITWADSHGKPMLLSEFGADAKANFRDPINRPKFSEDFQAEFYRQTLKMGDGIPFLRGVSPWILKDFQSPRREHPVYQQGWNRKGVVSETGERKLAFGVLADYYRRKAGDTR